MWTASNKWSKCRKCPSGVSQLWDVDVQVFPGCAHKRQMLPRNYALKTSGSLAASQEASPPAISVKRVIPY